MLRVTPVFPRRIRMRRSGPKTWQTVITAVWGAMLTPLAGAAPHQDRYHAIVQRTSFGIPHVKANDFGGLGYGYGYAFAQDNFCVLADRIVTVNAQRSFYFGETGNLSGDFFYKYIEDDTKLRALLSNSPEEVQVLIKRYASGYHRYLRETGAGNLPASCRNAAWVRAIDEIDLMRVYYALTLRARTETQLVAIVAPQPPVAPLAAAEPAAPAIDSASFQRPETLGIGSNAVALGLQAT